MHLVFIAEAPEGIIPRFEKWLRERIFRYNGMGRSVRLREIKCYDIVYPREIHEQVVGILKNMEHEEYVKLDLLKKFLKFFSKFIPKGEGIEIIDTSKIKTIKTTEFADKGITAKVLMLGTLKDEVRAGKEML